MDEPQSNNLKPNSIETLLWPISAAIFPLIVWKPGYDSFHEPKWLLLTGLVGTLLLIRSVRGPSIFTPRTPLDHPMIFGLVATFLSLRWDAGDRWVAFLFWSRLLVGYLLYRLCVTWLSESEESREVRTGRLQNAFVCGGAGVAAFALLQDWVPAARWSPGPVSDWRFHLSSTLGNPNEVGGYLSYLLPVLLVGWFRGTRGGWLWGALGLLYLYTLTTVFTVGAWLGLFVVPAICLCALSPEPPPSKKGLIATGATASILLFILLQGTLRFPQTSGRSLVFFGLALVCAVAVGFMLREFAPRSRRRAFIGLGGLVLVWATLLLPWGIPNHPEGLVQEAVSSPRWKGGFGARRFIWRTTGLMVKDHPIRGIGWGRYYTLHALYQGEVYRQRDLPHDRPSVGLVPQAHSDPLQFLAEGGTPASLAFGWIAAAAFLLGYRRIKSYRDDRPKFASSLWATWTGLGLIVFHCLVDFPLRQPQPVFLAVVFLAILSAPKRSRDPNPAPFFLKPIAILLGLLLFGAAAIGLRDQARLKRGFEALTRSGRTNDPSIRSKLLAQAEESLDSIRFPLPETHDLWIYRARVALEQGDFKTAREALEEAGKYRHGLSLYRAWANFASRHRDPKLSLEAVQGLIRYNPCWAPFHEDAARLERILGNEEKAKEFEADAERYRVR